MRTAAVLAFEVPIAQQGRAASEMSHDPVRAFDQMVTERRFRDAHAVAADWLAIEGPHSSQALTLMGQACWELRQTSLAKEYLDQAKKAGADDVRFHLVMAQAKRGAGEFPVAVEHAKRARDLAPDNASALVCYAVATFLSGNQKSALEILRTAPSSVRKSEDVARAETLINSFFQGEKLDLSLFGGSGDDLTLGTRPLEVSHPFIIQSIELTNHCPMKCVMCPRTHNMTRSLGHMDFETFKRIVDQWTEVDPTYGGQDVVWLHLYGESLVHPRFDDFISYGRQAGMPVGLSINPLILTRPIAERLIAAEPHTLWIALDGHDNESFEAIRGIPNAYEKSKANALRFAEMKAERKPDTHLEVIMINFPKNSDSIEAVAQFWSQIEGVDKFQAKGFTTWDGSVEEINQLNPSPENMKLRRACNFAWSKLSIMYNGDVVVCCYDYDGKYVVGNVNQSTLPEIWNGQRMKHLRASLASNIVLNKMCQNCENLCSA